MQKLLRSILVVLAVTLLATFGPPALAQTGSGASSTSSNDRLFLAFIEDATLARHQWWEGQIELSDGFEDPSPSPAGGGDVDTFLVPDHTLVGQTVHHPPLRTFGAHGSCIDLSSRPGSYRSPI